MLAFTAHNIWFLITLSVKYHPCCLLDRFGCKRTEGLALKFGKPVDSYVWAVQLLETPLVKIGLTILKIFNLQKHFLKKLLKEKC